MYPMSAARRILLAHGTVLPAGSVLVLTEHGVDNELTLFAACAKSRLSLAPRSVQAYLRSLMKYFDWLGRDPLVLREGWTRFSEVRLVRSAIERRLIGLHDCRLRTRQLPSGRQVCLIKPASNANNSVVIELAALKAFYDLCIGFGLYRDQNPFGILGGFRRSADVQDTRSLAQAPEPRGRMPRRSGVDPPPARREPDAYYQLTASLWKPDVRGEPDLRARVFDQIDRSGASLRNICITSLLFDSGCRISEACAITLRDWWTGSRFGNQIDSASKGSRGMNVKVLSLSKATAKLLRTYVETERRQLDGESRGLSDFELLARTQGIASGIPVFLTRSGTRVTPNLYRDRFFRPMARAAHLDMGPHATRHNFVSLALDVIERTANSPEERALLREQLVQYMRWGQGDRMLKVYDKRNRALQINEVVKKLQQEQHRKPRQMAVDERAAAPSRGDQILNQILGS